MGLGFDGDGLVGKGGFDAGLGLGGDGVPAGEWGVVGGGGRLGGVDEDLVDLLGPLLTPEEHNILLWKNRVMMKLGGLNKKIM